MDKNHFLEYLRNMQKNKKMKQGSIQPDEKNNTSGNEEANQKNNTNSNDGCKDSNILTDTSLIMELTKTDLDDSSSSTSEGEDISDDTPLNIGVLPGINFSDYAHIPVNVTGKDIYVPSSINSFETAGLTGVVLKNVRTVGFSVPTPIQKYAIPVALKKRDIMACAQTGSGKTAAYALPVIQKLVEEAQFENSPRALVVVPTRELAVQSKISILKFTSSTDLKVCAIYGGENFRKQYSEVQRGCDILVATIGRLLHFLHERIISLSSLKFLIIDEADLFFTDQLDLGHILNHRSLPPPERRQTIALSATFPDNVQKTAARFMHDHVFIAVGIVGGACKDIEQIFYEVDQCTKLDVLHNVLGQSEKGTLIFTNTLNTATYICSFIERWGYSVGLLSSKSTQREREKLLRDFSVGKVSIVVTVNIGARGLDLPVVQHVINYDLPQDINTYIQRIGRTGRLGNYGKASSFFLADIDKRIASALLKILVEANQHVPGFLNQCAGVGPAEAVSFGGFDYRYVSSFNAQTDGLPLVLQNIEDW